MTEMNQKLYELCLEIEELPTSEQQTKVAIFAAELESEFAKQKVINDFYLEGLDKVLRGYHLKFSLVQKHFRE